MKICHVKIKCILAILLAFDINYNFDVIVLQVLQKATCEGVRVFLYLAPKVSHYQGQSGDDN